MVDWALAYAAERGWAVVPMHEFLNGACTCKDGADCHRPARHARTRNGVKDASKDPVQIRAWWGKWPNANIGIATGEVSAITVVEADLNDNKPGESSPRRSRHVVKPLANGRGKRCNANSCAIFPVLSKPTRTPLAWPSWATRRWAEVVSARRVRRHLSEKGTTFCRRGGRDRQ